MPQLSGAAAFFDVDETLVTAKTMFSFLEFHLAATGHPPQLYRQARADLQQLAARGTAREDVNRAYYRLYAGASVAELTRQGEQWFERQLADPDFFHPPGVQALRHHLAAGDQVVLVSGSFFPCLDPIAHHLGAHEALGTPQLIANGHLTGEVSHPMIGPAKATSARTWAHTHGLDPTHCSAYGDHATDLDLLRAVGHPVVVGTDPLLLAEIASSGGSQLAGVSR
ncbi:HAD family hydrolase [Kitasatospora kifunensis]|uniref:HAD superfamily hydrolase (TIGR01490 family) n=1 Tax=Kitasatospora kifunensis TaxID=58351 RepID=A0A7W7VVP5_KITKI|nr:HAD family hydrolase [Kitasatospora kifunensis]MBB4924597.1 HAD superfamily hydrolase (TIGR01490 family) [Kitasatospora kifunensis]